MRFLRSLSGILACNPKPLPLGEGVCMLGGLCIVQSLLAYTPSIRAGLIIGGYRPSSLLGASPLNPIFLINKEVYRQSELEKKYFSGFLLYTVAFIDSFFSR